MKIYKEFKKTYHSYDEYNKDARNYFKELFLFREKNPDNDQPFHECEKYQLYLGYGKPEKVVSLIEKGILLTNNSLISKYKQLLENVKELKETINKVNIKADFADKMMLGEVFLKIDESIKEIES